MIKIINNILIFLISILLLSCSAKYQVVQKLDVNLYHLYNTRTKEIKIIVSKDNLKEGSLIKLNNVSVITEID